MKIIIDLPEVEGEDIIDTANFAICMVQLEDGKTSGLHFVGETSSIRMAVDVANLHKKLKALHPEVLAIAQALDLMKTGEETKDGRDS